MTDSQQPLWSASPERISNSRIMAFINEVNARRKLGLSNYHDLYQWSIDHIEDFWVELWDFAEVIAETRGKRVLVDPDKMPGARFFPEAKLNFAENLLLRHNVHRQDTDAIVFWGEDKIRRRMTHAELYDEVG